MPSWVNTPIIVFSWVVGWGLLGLVVYAFKKRSEKIFYFTDCLMVALAVVLLIWPALRRITVGNVLSVEMRQMRKEVAGLKKDMASLNEKITALSSKVRVIPARVHKLDAKIESLEKALSEALKALQEGVQPRAFPETPRKKTLPKFAPLPEGTHKTTPDVSEPPVKSLPQLAPKERIESDLEK